MKKGIALGAFFFGLGFIGSAFLWFFWKRRCNEACSEWVVISMLGTIAALPVVSAGSAVLLHSRINRIQAKYVLGIIETMGVVVWVVTLTHFAN